MRAGLTVEQVACLRVMLFDQHPRADVASADDDSGLILLPRADWLGRSPDPLEAGKVSGDHVAAPGLVEAEHGGMSGGDAVCMLVDEESTVSTIDRVVQNALVQPDLDVLHREH